jgi:hypothetical protein
MRGFVWFAFVYLSVILPSAGCDGSVGVKPRKPLVTDQSASQGARSTSETPIETIPEQIDLGAVPFGVRKEIDIHLTTHRREPVEVATVRTSCDCLTLQSAAPFVVTSSNNVPARLVLDLTTGKPFAGRLRIDVEGRTKSGEIAFQLPVLVEATVPSSQANSPEAAWFRHGIKVYCYLFFSEKERKDRLDKIVANGEPVQLSHSQCRFISARDRNAIACVELDLPESSIGRAIDLSLCWASGRECSVQGLKERIWVVYPSQYDFPLRVVDCAIRGDRAELSLYNESDEAKWDLQIIAVAVNSRDVTDNCLLPSGPLPADRQGYQQDLRFLNLPITWQDGSAVVELKYRLVPGRYASGEATVRSPQPLIVELWPGLPLPIGRSGGPTLPGCVCAHHEGLRPPVEEAVLQQRLRNIRRFVPDHPVYVSFDEVTTPTTIIAKSKGFDFCVLEPPLIRKEQQGDLTDDPGGFLRRLRGITTPWVASLNLTRSRTVTNQDFHWWMLTALGQGSRGLQWIQAAPIDSQKWTSWLRQQGEWLAHGMPVPLDIVADQPGVQVSAWLCGLDHIALFITNQWCTLAPGQANKSFYGISRRGVSLTGRTEPAYQPRRAHWCEGNCDLPLAPVGDGQWRVELPAFETGCLVRLRTAPGAVHVPVTGLPEKVRGVGSVAALEPVAPPFLKVGPVEPGQSIPIRLRIVNKADTRRTISGQPRGWGRVPPAVAQFTPVKAGPKESVELSSVWTAPGQAGAVVTAVWVFDTASPKDGFIFFIEGEVVSKFRAQPETLDFGRYRVRGAVAERQTLIRWDGSYPPIVAVAIEPPDHRLTVTRLAAGYFAVRLNPETVGAIRSNLRVQLSGSPDRHFSIPIFGEVMPVIQVRPSRLVFPATRAAQRILQVEGDGPLSIEVSGSLPPGITLDQKPKGTELLHRLRFSWEPSARLAARDADGEPSIVLVCQDPTGQTTTINIPVVWIAGIDDRAARGNDRASEQKREVAKENGAPLLETCIKQVDGLLRQLRAQPLPRDCPNWVMAHSLLFFGPSGSCTADEQTELKRRLRLFLRPADGGGANGCLSFYRDNPVFNRRGRLMDREHHPGQFFHYLAMADVPLETPLNVPGRTWTLQLLYDNWLRTIQPCSGEMSWVIPALAYYQSPGQSWIDKFGQAQRLGPYIEWLRKHPEQTCDQSHMMMAFARLLSRTAK